MNASKRRDDRSASSQKHSGDENIGHQSKDNIDTVRSSSVAGSNSFEEGMRIRCLALEFNGEGGEEDNLDCGARSIPERPRDAVFVRYGGGLEESCCPGPGGNDGG